MSLHPISVREFRSRLADCLQAVEGGESLVITSRNRPVARLLSVQAIPEGLPDIPGVIWSKNAPRLSQPIEEFPEMAGEPLASWVIANRR
jgi:prevent-host-death family protein